MSNLTTNDLMDMTPGELEMLWEQVKEVNAAFFRIARGVGLRQGAGGVPGSVAQRSDGGGSEPGTPPYGDAAGGGRAQGRIRVWVELRSSKRLRPRLQRRDERMKDAALALRVALHTDGRQFKAFLEA